MWGGGVGVQSLVSRTEGFWCGFQVMGGFRLMGLGFWSVSLGLRRSHFPWSFYIRTTSFLSP